MVAAAHLPQAGYSRRRLQAAEMRGLVKRGVVGEGGGRADEAHFAANHIDELRQFIDAEAAEPVAGLSHALVVGELEHALAAGAVLGRRLALANPLADVVAMRRIVGGPSHLGQLAHAEWPAAHPDTRLAEQDRAAVEESDRERARRENGGSGDPE